jgi:hypothetical protein
LSELRPVTEAGGRGKRSISKIVLTDAEAGAAVFAGSDSRSYNYFEPKKRRATKYEDVTDIVFEPLVSELFRSRFLMRFAPAHGDFLTPSIIGVSEREFNDRDLAYTRDMMKDFLEDQETGESNRDLMEGWLAEWMPYSVAAAKGLEPIWSEPEKQAESFDDSFARVKNRFEGILSDLGLRVPEGVIL